jgi:hypothetical protein
MKRTKRNPRIGRDALADVERRMKRNPKLRARIDAAVARATIGVMVKRARTATGLTQAQLATRAGTTQAVIAPVGRQVFGLSRVAGPYRPRARWAPSPLSSKAYGHARRRFFSFPKLTRGTRNRGFRGLGVALRGFAVAGAYNSSSSRVQTGCRSLRNQP